MGRYTADELLGQVHDRIGAGVSIETSPDDQIEAHWRRDYGEDGMSDPRPIALGYSLADVFQQILDYEDRADAQPPRHRAMPLHR